MRLRTILLASLILFAGFLCGCQPTGTPATTQPTLTPDQTAATELVAAAATVGAYAK